MSTALIAITSILVFDFGLWYLALANFEYQSQWLTAGMAKFCIWLWHSGRHFVPINCSRNASLELFRDTKSSRILSCYLDFILYIYIYIPAGGVNICSQTVSHFTTNCTGLWPEAHLLAGSNLNDRAFIIAIALGLIRVWTGFHPVNLEGMWWLQGLGCGLGRRTPHLHMDAGTAGLMNIEERERWIHKLLIYI